MTTTPVRAPRPIGFAVFTIVLGAIGWFASFELLNEYLHKLKNPDYVPNCNISVLVSCSDNMGSWQGSVLGFSNTIIGISAFVAPIAVGVALLAGARFSRWFWWLYQGGLFLGFCLISWLAFQSVFVLGRLCPWCMVIWTVTIPLFWITFLRAPAVGDVPLSEPAQRRFRAVYSWGWVIVLLCYVVIAAVAQFQLDWLAEFSR
ncbi:MULTISPECIES: vitamin K epoxide reductase family protein [unclassified Leucobacter]|uniref:vitamin K epoxide reductase family protein n=1 Tax=unclassified Leucobacter TaxID=2621730 RepID=UPI0006224025|nr:vitamin K epoxide reductase family protein [Leucobacter sp. Ag1]KKI16871.1 membrane protein [Leucobacter sp. Ag1]